jgi:guanine deaminase
MRDYTGMTKRAVRGTLLDCISDPWQVDDEKTALRYIPDGALLYEDDRLVDIGPAEEILPANPSVTVEDFTGDLIVPGFVDVHLHYAQTKIIGSFGRQLLDWLQTYTFPEELKLVDKSYADEVAGIFFQEMFRCGTTTVQSFATTHPNSVIAFFEEAQRQGVQALCGLTGIDREGAAPDAYRDTADGFYDGSKELLAQFHGRGRCLYSVSPRFAFGSTPAQLQAAGRLAREHPDCWIQTHLSENPAEIAAVLELFPDCPDYLGVYEKYGLVRKRFVAGHSIYLSEDEFRRLGEAEASIAFCPASNLFLGSGFFQWDRADHHRVRWGLGCDSGGGNTMSILRTLDDAYKVGMLQVVTSQREKCEESLRLSAAKALFAATLGSARCLDLQHEIGNFDKGKAADFVVLDTGASPVLDFRRGSERPRTSLEAACHQFFGMMMVWVPEVVKATFVSGRRAYRR